MSVSGSSAFAPLPPEVDTASSARSNCSEEASAAFFASASNPLVFSPTDQPEPIAASCRWLSRTAAKLQNYASMCSSCGGSWRMCNRRRGGAMLPMTSSQNIASCRKLQQTSSPNDRQPHLAEEDVPLIPQVQVDDLQHGPNLDGVRDSRSCTRTTSSSRRRTSNTAWSSWWSALLLSPPPTSASSSSGLDDNNPRREKSTDSLNETQVVTDSEDDPDRRECWRRVWSHAAAKPCPHAACTASAVLLLVVTLVLLALLSFPALRDAEVPEALTFNLFFRSSSRDELHPRPLTTNTSSSSSSPPEPEVGEHTVEDPDEANKLSVWPQPHTIAGADLLPKKDRQVSPSFAALFSNRTNLEVLQKKNKASSTSTAGRLQQPTPPRSQDQHQRSLFLYSDFPAETYLQALDRQSREDYNDDSRMRRRVKVTLNVYSWSDSSFIHTLNGVLNWLGWGGAHHAGVEIRVLSRFGDVTDPYIQPAEYAYGGGRYRDRQKTGVHKHRPCNAIGKHKLMESVELGTTYLSVHSVESVVKDFEEGKLQKEWLQGQYDLLRHNCCHFCTAFVKRLDAQQEVEMQEEKGGRIQQNLLPDDTENLERVTLMDNFPHPRLFSLADKIRYLKDTVGLSTSEKAQEKADLKDVAVTIGASSSHAVSNSRAHEDTQHNAPEKSSWELLGSVWEQIPSFWELFESKKLAYGEAIVYGGDPAAPQESLLPEVCGEEEGDEDEESEAPQQEEDTTPYSFWRWYEAIFGKPDEDPNPRGDHDQDLNPAEIDRRGAGSGSTRRGTAPQVPPPPPRHPPPPSGPHPLGMSDPDAEDSNGDEDGEEEDEDENKSWPWYDFLIASLSGQGQDVQPPRSLPPAPPTTGSLLPIHASRTSSSSFTQVANATSSPDPSSVEADPAFDAIVAI
ncbi:unnamed protein product [Amoebophrya sp. A25]|nr:unnamed protein product [Amoebophrya sp. A25]|eukprot:GSA25T00014548001.1